MRCPRCRAEMMRWRNSFYGVGLAVHEFAYDCPECGYLQFAPPTSEEEAEDQPQAPEHRSGLSRVLQLIGGRR